MIDGLVPEDAVGHVQQARCITLAPFDRLSEETLNQDWSPGNPSRQRQVAR
jgi:hypothetical protein